MTKVLVAAAAIGCSAGLSAQTIIKVGASQQATTIQAAYSVEVPADITGKGAYIIELQSDYDPTLETYPIKLTAKTGASATENITIKPATGVKVVLSNPDQTTEFKDFVVPAAVTELTLPSVENITAGMRIIGYGITTITKVLTVNTETKKITLDKATIAAPPATTTIYIGPGSETLQSYNAQGTKTIVFDGAKYVTIDGVSRTGNTGLTIQNPNNISAQTLYFTGTTVNSVLTPTEGNVVKNCFIRGANICGSEYGKNPADGRTAQIWFDGAGANNNTIENCDICDIEGQPMPLSLVTFNNSGATATDVNTFNNNNLYNFNVTASSQSGNVGAFSFPSGSSPNCVITNNRIFWSKLLEKTAKDLYVFGFGGGSAGVSNRVEGNVVGGTDANNDGIATFDLNSATFSVLNVNDNTTLKNNTVKNIKIIANVAATFLGARVSANQKAKAPVDAEAWSGNTVKDITIEAKNTITAIAYQINSADVHPARNISNNVISNISIKSSDTTKVCTMRGLQIQGTASTALWNVSKNTISNLTAGDAISIAANATIGLDAIGNSDKVEKNLVYNLNVINNKANGKIYGLRMNGSNATGTTVQNNMVRLGTDVASNVSIFGLVQNAAVTTGTTTNPINIYHNSVYIGGTTPATATMSSFAFKREGIKGTSDVRNNIFANQRVSGNSVKAENHYAIGIQNADDFKDCDFNVLQFNGALGLIGLDNIKTTQVAWTTETTYDPNSIVADPKFIDATGTTPNLHIQATSPADGKGDITLVTVADDFDGDTRSGLTPSDIGADAPSGSSAIAGVSKNEVVAVAKANAIEVLNAAGKVVTIYSLTGQVVKSVSVTSAKETIAINKGFYIVKVGTSKTKLFVK